MPTDSCTPPHPVPPASALPIPAWTVTCAVGAGRQALLDALRTGRSGLHVNDFNALPLPTYIGRVSGLEDLPLPPDLAAWDCRNNRLAWLAIQQDGFLEQVRAAVQHHGAHRVAVVLGTSTSSIGATEEAYRRLTPEGRFPPDLLRREIHNPHSLAGFVRELIGAQGPTYTVATACSSSAKVFAQAERLIRCGLVDAAVVGGVDSLCDSVFYGFHSLGLVSPQPCRPFDARRDGISLAEAGGYALLVRPAAEDMAHTSVAAPVLRLSGHGESSDAHHMSTPHPQGLGARLAMTQALKLAGLRAQDIDYINLHGTATRKNDEVEAQAIAALFPPTLRASSTKGWTGHTLGAAGMVEAAICLLGLSENWTPGTLYCDEPDPEMPPAFQAMLKTTAQAGRELRHAMSNSFGFGGNNCSLIFSRDPGGPA